MKKIAPWLLLAAVIIIAVYSYAKSKGEEALLKERIKNETEKVELYAGQIEMLAGQRKEMAATLEKFQAASQAREQWFQAQLAKVSTATPAQLVDQGSHIVNATDISTDGKAVTMGVETYRAFVTIAVDWKEYKEVREPGWKSEKSMYEGQIANYKATEALDAQKDAALAASIADLKSYISAKKTSTFFEKVLWAGAGIGFGMLVNSVTH